jgi:hypothetical protein
VSRLAIGCGAREVLAAPGRGEVLAVYRRAAYLRLPAGIVALVAPGVPPGPLWITAVAPKAWVVDGIYARQPPTPWGDAVATDPVAVRDGWLEIDGARISLGGAETWQGPLPDPAQLQAAVPFALDVLTGAPASALLDDPWRPALHRAEAAVGQDDLAGAATALGGVGPGLTPAGDDALAGILLAHRALTGAGAEDELLALARSATTTDLSCALLAWAARGQAVEPVHDLLAALAAGDHSAAVLAMETVAALGASSGADLLLGLRLGLCAKDSGVIATP